MNNKNKDYFNKKIQAQLASAQKVANNTTYFSQVNNKEEKKQEETKIESSLNTEDKLIKKLDNIEKLLKELVDINYSALHLMINDENNKEFFQNKVNT